MNWKYNLKKTPITLYNLQCSKASEIDSRLLWTLYLRTLPNTKYGKVSITFSNQINFAPLKNQREPNLVYVGGVGEAFLTCDRHRVQPPCDRQTGLNADQVTVTLQSHARYWTKEWPPQVSSHPHREHIYLTSDDVSQAPFINCTKYSWV